MENATKNEVSVVKDREQEQGGRSLDADVDMAAASTGVEAAAAVVVEQEEWLASWRRAVRSERIDGGKRMEEFVARCVLLSSK